MRKDSSERKLYFNKLIQLTGYFMCGRRYNKMMEFQLF